MIVFSDLSVEPSVFTYKIRAENKGVYTLPPVQAEAMYNRSLQAHSAGGVMVVEEEASGGNPARGRAPPGPRRNLWCSGQKRYSTSRAALPLGMFDITAAYIMVG